MTNELHHLAKIEPEKRAIILEGIKKNLPYEFCAHRARICEKTLYNWINRGEEDNKQNIDSEYSRFLQDIKQAEQDKISSHLDSVEAQTERWQARSWILERRWRKHFSVDSGEISELKNELKELKELILKQNENKNQNINLPSPESD